MCSPCVHHVFTMCSPCVHHVFTMCSPCVHHVHLPDTVRLRRRFHSQNCSFVVEHPQPQPATTESEWTLLGVLHSWLQNSHAKTNKSGLHARCLEGANCPANSPLTFQVLAKLLYHSLLKRVKQVKRFGPSHQILYIVQYISGIDIQQILNTYSTLQTE